MIGLKEELDTRQLAILSSEMEKRKKSVLVAYLLYLFFGSIGAHKFYLEETEWGIVYLSFLILGIATFAFGVGIFLLGFMGICLLVDLFTIPKQVRKYNDMVENEIILELTRIGAKKNE